MPPADRARLALARAALTGAPVVLVDDLLSTLDTTTSRELAALCRREFLEPGQHGRSGESALCVVSTRVGEALGCDRVVVLHMGRAVEQGPPGELVARGATYSAFAHLLAMEAPPQQQPQPQQAAPAPQQGVSIAAHHEGSAGGGRGATGGAGDGAAKGGSGKESRRGAKGGGGARRT